jgi:hypothetical protein
MSLYSVSDVTGRFGWENPNAGIPGVADLFREIQGLRRSFLDGFSAGASAELTGASAGGGDTLLSVVAHATVGLPVDVTQSASLSNNRIKIVDANTANKTLDVLWWNKDNA